MADPTSNLALERARAAALVALYWPRRTNAQYFADEIALARKHGKHERVAHLELLAAEHGIEWRVASGVQREVA